MIRIKLIVLAMSFTQLKDEVNILARTKGFTTLSVLFQDEESLIEGSPEHVASVLPLLSLDECFGPEEATHAWTNTTLIDYLNAQGTTDLHSLDQEE